jgi:protein-L-isoaspartate O-methyltransferase
LIITTSAALEIPEKLIDQLKIDGILLIPIGRAAYYQERFRVRK